MDEGRGVEVTCWSEKGGERLRLRGVWGVKGFGSQCRRVYLGFSVPHAYTHSPHPHPPLPAPKPSFALPLSAWEECSNPG